MKKNNQKQQVYARTPSVRDFLWIASVALIYFAVARLSLLLVFQPEGIAAVWPPSGIFLSAILLTRRNVRPYLVAVLFVTDFIAEMLTGTPLFVSAIYALELTGDAVLSSWLLLRFAGEPIMFRKVRDVFCFLALAIILSNGLLSFVAAAASGFIPGTSFWTSWKWWAASTGIGNLLVTPFILSWASWGKTRLATWNPKRVFEIVVLFILLALVNFVSFRYLLTSGLFSLFLPYLIFPFLLWAALRFEMCGVTSGLVILAAIAVVFVVTGSVSVFRESQLGAVIVLQLYLAIMAVPSLFLAAVVTERKRSEEALKDNEEKFRKIYDKASDGILIADTITKKFLQGNTAICSMLGYTKEEIENLAIYDIHPPKDISHVLDAFEKQIKGEIVIAENLPVLRKDGSIFYADISSSYTIIGGIHCLVGFFRDITERKQMEDSLFQVSQEWQTTFNATNSAIWILDKNQRVLRSNKAAERIFRQSSDRVLGKQCWEIVHGTDRPIDGCPILQAKKSLRRETMELQIGEGWFEVTVDPILDTSGQFSGAVHIVSDITERKRSEKERENLQEQLHQAQKLESVGRLAGGVAHDYNNMLSVILGYTELAMNKVDPSSPLHAELTEIFTAAKRSADITRQLLAFARKQTIAPKVLDINKTVESMLKMLRRLIGEDIDLTWLPESNLWLVKIDPSQIEQILANLCINARDAIAGVGKVTIETHRAILDEAYCTDNAGFVPGEYALLAVSDNGCGMDKETLDSIFEPFFTTKDMNQGTGLGLATVYGIVKQNNGFINVYSEPGKGTSFKIYLPHHIGETGEIRTETVTEIPSSNSEMVLLVEDEPSIRKLGRKMLEKLGYQVLAAGTPCEAIRVAGKQPGGIHLLITDVVMPEMNGRDLAERLHAHYPDIKILFMSGYTADVIAHRGVLDKGVNFIQKPFSIKDLAAKVRAVLDTTKT